MKSNATMSIGEVADHFGLATHVLRHWEAEGLLAPARANGGRRRYGHADLHRVAGILLGREAGLALSDIRALMTAADREDRRAIQRRYRDELVRRIEQLQSALAFVEGGLACPHEHLADCPNYQAMISDRMNGRAPHRQRADRPGSLGPPSR